MTRSHLGPLFHGPLSSLAAGLSLLPGEHERRVRACESVPAFSFLPCFCLLCCSRFALCPLLRSRRVDPLRRQTSVASAPSLPSCMIRLGNKRLEANSFCAGPYGSVPNNGQRRGNARALPLPAAERRRGALRALCATRRTTRARHCLWVDGGHPSPAGALCRVAPRAPASVDAARVEHVL